MNRPLKDELQAISAELAAIATSAGDITERAAGELIRLTRRLDAATERATEAAVDPHRGLEVRSV